MKNYLAKIKISLNDILIIILASAVTIFLMVHKLSSLTGGVAPIEVVSSRAIVGWHGIYHSPFLLPLHLLRSIDFKLYPHHGIGITRLPNVILGCLSCINFAGLIYLWHGKRTTILASLLFVFSAWTLHVSRLASNDVVYLWGITTLLIVHTIYYEFGEAWKVWLLNLLTWSLLLTIPGFIWLIVFDVWFQRNLIKKSFRDFRTPFKIISQFIAAVLFIPLVGIGLSRPGQVKLWLGLPMHLPSITHLLRNFAAVFIHLFVRGPEYPTLWLSKSPLLDAFTLTASIIGIYFYLTKRKSSRSYLLFGFSMISAILISLHGAVSFALIVPFMYITAATGIAYLLRSWLKTFPTNPFARYFGIGIVSLAVIIACAYNYRAYFVAWPNTNQTKQTFSQRL